MGFWGGGARDLEAMWLSDSLLSKPGLDEVVVFLQRMPGAGLGNLAPPKMLLLDTLLPGVVPAEDDACYCSQCQDSLPVAFNYRGHKYAGNQHSCRQEHC